jgi:hypothetical protein
VALGGVLDEVETRKGRGRRKAAAQDEGLKEEEADEEEEEEDDDEKPHSRTTRGSKQNTRTSASPVYAEETVGVSSARGGDPGGYPQNRPPLSCTQGYCKYQKVGWSCQG